MVFGLSYGELALIMVAGAVILGPKDIPVLARGAGRAIGRATGYIRNAQSKITDYADRTKIQQLHEEVQQTMAQLAAIQAEVRAGVSLTRPGPITRRIFQEASGGLPAGANTRAPGGTAPSDANVHVPSAVPHSHDSDAAQGSGGSDTWQPATLTRYLDSAAQPPSHVPTGNHQRAPHGSERVVEKTTETISEPFAGSVPGDSTTSAQSATSAERPADSARWRSSAEEGRKSHLFEVLPISALDAGIIPKRKDGSETGADILSDAILEEQIARQAKVFLRR